MNQKGYWYGFFAAVFFLTLMTTTWPVSVYAQSAETNGAETTTTHPQGTLVADVGVHDCAYSLVTAEAGDQTVHITCTLINKYQNQGDIHYGVSLVNKVGDKRETLDTMVSPKILSLRTNQSVEQVMDYTPPRYLSGTYELWAFAKTSDGMPLATNYLGEVNLKGDASSYVDVRGETCSIRLKGSSGSDTYDPSEGVDIRSDEILEGTCTAVAHGAAVVNVTPSFVTYRRTVFGDRVEDSQDAQTAVSFKNNETKKISFVIPRAAAPQSYEAVMMLVTSNGKPWSNSVQFHYVVTGASATIQSVALDKDSYQAGDMAHVGLFWTGSADNFFGARTTQTDNQARTLVLSMRDGRGSSCGEAATYPVTSNGNAGASAPSYDYHVTQKCADPRVDVQIRDVANAALAQKTVAFASEPVSEIPPSSALTPSFKSRIFLVFGIGTITLMAAIACYVYLRRKRNGSVNKEETL